MATIVGTPASETIRGTAGADVIVGGGADGEPGDRISGLGGADRICAEPFDPAVARGGAGDDRILGSGFALGGPGEDKMTYAAPLSIIVGMFGGKGDDVMRSRATDVNFFVPGPGDDTLLGRPGSHIFNVAWFRGARGGVVADLRSGTALGQGDDALTGINYVLGSRHADVIFGDGDLNGLFGSRGSDVLVGRGGRDFVIGGDRDDRVDGGPGNDYLAGRDGRDVLFGRAGNDQLFEKPQPESNLILAGVGRDRCYGGYLVPPNVERGCESHEPPPHQPLGMLTPRLSAAR